MDIDAIKEISLVVFLHRLGYDPPDATARVCGFMRLTATRESHRSMSTRAKMYGSISVQAKAATSSRSPGYCQARPISLSKHGTSPKR